MKKLIFVVALVSVSPVMAAGADKGELLKCVNTLNSEISNQWNTDGSTIECDAKNRRCYVLTPKEDYFFDFGGKPVKSLKTVDPEIASRKMNIKHYYVSFEREGVFSKQRLDLEDTENGMFARKLSDKSDGPVLDVVLHPVEKRNFEGMLLSQVKGNLKLLQRNIERNSFPTGWTREKYLAKCKERLNGCSALHDVEELKPLFDGVKACQ